VLAALTSTDHGLTIFLSIGKKISTGTVATRLQLFIRLVVVRFFQETNGLSGPGTCPLNIASTKYPKANTVRDHSSNGEHR
jgi:hypothetical protein